MRWYNLREGLTAADDRLPDRFFEEPIASGPRRGDVLNRAAFVEAIHIFVALCENLLQVIVYHIPRKI